MVNPFRARQPHDSSGCGSPWLASTLATSHLRDSGTSPLSSALEPEAGRVRGPRGADLISLISALAASHQFIHSHVRSPRSPNLGRRRELSDGS